MGDSLRWTLAGIVEGGSPAEISRVLSPRFKRRQVQPPPPLKARDFSNTPLEVLLPEPTWAALTGAVRRLVSSAAAAVEEAGGSVQLHLGQPVIFHIAAPEVPSVGAGMAELGPAKDMQKGPEGSAGEEQPKKGGPVCSGTGDGSHPAATAAKEREVEPDDGPSLQNISSGGAAEGEVEREGQTAEDIIMQDASAAVDDLEQGLQQVNGKRQQSNAEEAGANEAEEAPAKANATKGASKKDGAPAPSRASRRLVARRCLSSSLAAHRPPEASHSCPHHHQPLCCACRER
jgi:hypothetical protein